VGRGRSEDDRPDVLPGPYRAGRQVTQLDAPRGNRRSRTAAAGLTLLRPRGGDLSGGRGCRAGLRWRRGRRRCRGSRSGAGATRAGALRGAGVHLVGDPLRVRREGPFGGVGHRDFRVGLEIQQVQDRLRLGGDGVGEMKSVGDPLPVARYRLARDAAPLRIIVDGSSFMAGAFRAFARTGPGSSGFFIWLNPNGRAGPCQE
jgi:hypothetical protein